MRLNLEKQKRRSIRLKGYDYSRAGYYYVTICTKNRDCIFGNIKNDQMLLNEAGDIVQRYWINLNNKFKNIKTDKFIVMPNHLHGIIRIVGRGLINQTLTPNQNPNTNTNWILMKDQKITIGKIIRSFKARATYQIRRQTEFYQIWQRNYYERIIRNKKELKIIREYITNNPSNWKIDENNPLNISD